MQIETLRSLVAAGKWRRPELASRFERAAMIVVLRTVEQTDTGTWHVESDREPGSFYAVTDTCTCQDVHRAPGGWCKHRLAVALLERARAREHARTGQQDRLIITVTLARAA